MLRKLIWTADLGLFFANKLLLIRFGNAGDAETPAAQLLKVAFDRTLDFSEFLGKLPLDSHLSFLTLIDLIRTENALEEEWRGSREKKFAKLKARILGECAPPDNIGFRLIP